MARKSRKNQEQAAVTVMQEPTIRAALYIRLSVEDTRTNSISIETQQLILNHYLESQPEMSCSIRCRPFSTKPPRPRKSVRSRPIRPIP